MKSLLILIHCLVFTLLLSQNNQEHKPELKQEIAVKNDAKKLAHLSKIKSLLKQPQNFATTLSGKTEQKTILAKRIVEIWQFNPNVAKKADSIAVIYSTIVVDAYEINGFDGSNKNMKALALIKQSMAAKPKKTRFVLGITSAQPDTRNFLQNKHAQQNLIEQVIKLLAQQPVNGLNVRLDGAEAITTQAISQFLETLSKQFKPNQKDLQLSLTIPAFDSVGAYRITSLTKIVDRFIIDFSTPIPNSNCQIPPLKAYSNYSIDACVSRYLNQTLASPKQVLLLQPNTEAINTFSEKLDFILNDGLGGVAIWNNRKGSDLNLMNEELAYKLITIDTITNAAATVKVQYQGTNSSFNNINVWLKMLYVLGGLVVIGLVVFAVRRKR